MKWESANKGRAHMLRGLHRDGCHTAVFSTSLSHFWVSATPISLLANKVVILSPWLPGLVNPKDLGTFGVSPSRPKPWREKLLKDKGGLWLLVVHFFGLTPSPCFLLALMLLISRQLFFPIALGRYRSPSPALPHSGSKW